MALTGLQIFKLLPNKNCNECGVPTCLAFAMKLAAKTVEPAKCPYISEESLAILDSSQAPPINKIKFDFNGKKIEIGGETVLCRHEKTFVNQPIISLEVEDSLPEDEFQEKVAAIMSFSYERVGMILSPEALSLKYRSGDQENYFARYQMIRRLEKILVLTEVTAEILSKILKEEEFPQRLVINAVSHETYSQIIPLVKGTSVKVVVTGSSLEELFSLVQKAMDEGVKLLLLKVDNHTIPALLQDNVFLRRLAIHKQFCLAGFPVFNDCQDSLPAVVLALCKYSSFINVTNIDGAAMFPLLTLRQNIYTDPQKPLQIEPGYYAIGEPRPSDPLVVTTNFSLTYFIVSGEIENSPFNAHLLATDSEGMSVLTAWAANKFSPELISKIVAESAVIDKISHRKMIIPGYVASIKGDLEDEMKDWEILVGPQEAADIPFYFKETWVK